MKKQLIAGAIASALSIPFILGVAQKNQLERIKGAAQSPILAGVLVPANTTLLYLSGQVPQAIDTSKPTDSIEAYGDTKAQTISVFNKIKALLEQQGLGLSDVIKLTVFLTGDPKKGNKLDFKGFSEGYAQFFGTATQPNLVARSTVQVAALVNPGFLVEIEATAAKTAP